MVEERVLTPEAEDEYLEWGKLFDSVGCTAGAPLHASAARTQETETVERKRNADN